MKIQEIELHEAMAAALADNGVSVMFGVMGDGNIFLVNTFGRRPDCTYVAATHEASAILMALAYSNISQSVGVATVTHGPGVSNTVSGLIEGVKGRIPMVLLCGDLPIGRKGTWQDIPQRELIVSTGAGFEEVRSAKTAVEDLRNAIRRALVEYRPIVLNIPSDLFLQKIQYAPAIVRLPSKSALVSESADIDSAVGLIASSRRPIILAGRGAIHAKAELINLAGRTGALLATTLKAKDLFSGHMSNIGIFGTLSSPRTTDLIIKSDCIISFGASLNYATTAEGTFVSRKKLIQCNLEWAELGRFALPDAGLVGDPQLVAKLILHWLDEAEIPSSAFREELDVYDTVNEDQRSKKETNDEYSFEEALSILSNAVSPDRILVTDGGRFAGEARANTKVSEPRFYVQNWNFGAIGFGVASAVGAAFADRSKPVLLIVGDGGFMLGGVAEFNTAVRYDIDLVTIICNDGSYGSEHAVFLARQMDPALSLVKWPDFAPVAESLGGHGVTVKCRADLAVAVDAIKNHTKPLLIDLKLNPDKMPGRRD